MRKYALMKVQSGDYLLPDNDGEHLWRVRSYVDGSALGLDVSYTHRTFWAAYRFFGTFDEFVQDPERFLNDDTYWRVFEQFQPARRYCIEAIEETWPDVLPMGIPAMN
jgi:hypothetical protein